MGRIKLTFNRGADGKPTSVTFSKGAGSFTVPPSTDAPAEKPKHTTLAEFLNRPTPDSREQADDSTPKKNG